MTAAGVSTNSPTLDTRKHPLRFVYFIYNTIALWTVYTTIVITRAPLVPVIFDLIVVHLCLNHRIL